jgi:TIR domain
MPRDIFVSYSKSDEQCAFEMVARLEARGMSVWVAPRDVSPSADWAEEIIDAISAARVMVLVFSAHSNASAQVRREVERAVHKGLRILPFRIEEALPSKSLEYFLSAQHWLDAFPPPLGPHYDRLGTFLEAALAMSATSSPPNSAAPLAPAARESAVGGTARAAEAAQMQRLETELARYLGPVAKILVRRAATNALGIEQLTLRVSAEIDSEHDRKKFIATCAQAGLSGP